MKILKEGDYFESADLSLVAALCCHGFRVETIQKKTYGNRSVFLLLREKGLDDCVQAFWAHSLQVDPLSYFSILRELKTRLYQPME